MTAAPPKPDPRRAAIARAIGQAVAGAVWREITAPEPEDAKRAGPGEDDASREDQENDSERHTTA
jgi:hypothetical protein